MTSPTFGRKEAREVAARRARRTAAIRHAVTAGTIGLALLIASGGAFAIGKSGLSAWLAIAAIGSFFMVAAFAGDA